MDTSMRHGVSDHMFITVPSALENKYTKQMDVNTLY